MFNHESPLCPERFPTRKTVAAVARITAGSKERFWLGNTDIARDWGRAAEYFDAMWRMLQQITPSDYMIATGETRNLFDFIEVAFARVGVDWRKSVMSTPIFFQAK